MLVAEYDALLKHFLKTTKQRILNFDHSLKIEIDTGRSMTDDDDDR